MLHNAFDYGLSDGSLIAAQGYAAGVLREGGDGAEEVFDDVDELWHGRKLRIEDSGRKNTD